MAKRINFGGSFEGNNKRFFKMVPNSQRTIKAGGYRREHSRDFPIGEATPDLNINIKALKEVKKPSQRLRLIQKVLSENPNNWRNYALVNELARIYIDINEPEKARECYLTIIKYRPDDASALDALGYMALSKGDLKEAEAYYRKLHMVDSYETRGTNGLGQIRLITNRFHEAVNWFKLSLESDPKDRFARYGLGQALMTLGDYDGAEMNFRMILEKDPGNERALFGMAMLSLTKNDPDTAKTRFMDLIRMNPNNVYARYGMGNLSLSVNDLEAAEQYYSEALNRQPANQPCLKGMVAIAIAKGDMPRANAFAKNLNYYSGSAPVDLSGYDFSRHAEEKCASDGIAPKEVTDTAGSRPCITMGTEHFLEFYVMVKEVLYRVVASPERNIVITLMKVCRAVEKDPSNKDDKAVLPEQNSGDVKGSPQFMSLKLKKVKRKLGLDDEGTII